MVVGAIKWIKKENQIRRCVGRVSRLVHGIVCDIIILCVGYWSIISFDFISLVSRSRTNAFAVRKIVCWCDSAVAATVCVSVRAARLVYLRLGLWCVVGWRQNLCSIAVRLSACVAHPMNQTGTTAQRAIRRKRQKFEKKNQRIEFTRFASRRACTHTQ